MTPEKGVWSWCVTSPRSSRCCRVTNRMGTLNMKIAMPHLSEVGMLEQLWRNYKTLENECTGIDIVCMVGRPTRWHTLYLVYNACNCERHTSIPK